jgi:CheY-like chemotaxis protein/signal transduction histidine kinase
MKITKKFFIYILSVALILAVILIIFIARGVNPLLQELDEQTRLVHVDKGEIEKVKMRERQVMYLTLYAIPLLGFIYVLILFIYISRNIVRPLTKAVEFSNALARGEFPQKLKIRSSSDEIAALIKSQNFLRDRLHNTIHKLRTSHKREQDARKEAESASNLKSNFLSRLSPELRSPLNAINGYIGIIQNDLDKGCYDRLLQQRIEAVSRNAAILNRQVANLLDIGKLGSEENYLNITEFNTADFMRELVEYSVFCLNELDISLVNHLSPDVPETINTDREVLSLVLNTLIRAIARVSGSGETISCGCELENDKLIFWVRDNRKAECKEPLASLYNRLSPIGADSFASTASPSVLNMLLASSKASIISGEMSALSSEDANTEFRLAFDHWDIIPEHSFKKTARAHAAANYRVESTPFDIDDSFELDQELFGESYRVLLAEDDRDNAEILSTFLQEDGCEVSGVADGAECMDAIEKDGFDMVIMSLFLPRTDVYAMIRKIREQKSTAHVPIVVITGYLSQKDRQQLIVSGVSRCFVKPLNFDLLRKTVRKLCKETAKKG